MLNNNRGISPQVANWKSIKCSNYITNSGSLRGVLSSLNLFRATPTTDSNLSRRYCLLVEFYSDFRAEAMYYGKFNENKKGE